MKLTMMIVLMLVAVIAATEYEFVIEETYDSPYNSVYGLDCHDVDGTLLVKSVDGPVFFLGYGNLELSWSWSGHDGWGACVLPQSTEFVFCSNADNRDDIQLRRDEGNYCWTDNPAGDNGHGMDTDLNGYVWEVDYNDNLYKMSLTDSTLTTEMQYNLTGISGSPQGLTCVDYYALGLTNHILISANSSMYLYEVIGSALVFVDQIPNPVNDYSPRGLAFSHANQTFYWCYQATSSSSSVEIVRMTLAEVSALEQSTWANVKTLF